MNEKRISCCIATVECVCVCVCVCVLKPEWVVRLATGKRHSHTINGSLPRLHAFNKNEGWLSNCSRQLCSYRFVAISKFIIKSLSRKLWHFCFYFAVCRYQNWSSCKTWRNEGIHHVGTSIGVSIFFVLLFVSCLQFLWMKTKMCDTFLYKL
jgi:hypothetical protein